MKKKLFKIGFFALAAAIFIGGLFALPVKADVPLNCDSNAIVYCGTPTKTALYNALNHGTGKQYQSSYDLKYVFGKYGINTSQFEKLKNGRVTSNNNVYVGDARVASNVYSTGRHATPNSIREPWAVAYPIYRRHPSESFLSSSIDAFVYMNDDGTMAYAIIKSCGNIVPGVGVKANPAPAPTPAYRLYAYKYIDANSNGRWETSERAQSGVTFRLSGNNVSKTAVSGSDGFAGFYGLPAGTYTITESVPSGYRATSANPQVVTVSRDQQIVRFGNARILIPAPKTNLQVVKYNDINGNRTQDSGEGLLSGWQFRVIGNGINRTVTTDANGQYTLTGIPYGSYTVTEILRTGWENTTGLAVTRNVNATPSTQRFVFGNRLIPPTTNIQVFKFNDLNANGVQDRGESALRDWQFRITGSGRTWTLVTDANGTRTLTGIPVGRYTVTEINQPGWENTTGGLTITRNVTTNPSTQRFVFGNRLTPIRTVQLQVVKFEDVNGNRVQDNEEDTLSGWQFRVTGNGRTYNVVTDANGQVTVRNLTAGRYTVTEINQNGWENTTGLTQVHDVTNNAATQRFIFGNRRIIDPPTPTPGGDTAQPLPKSGPGEAAATAGATTTLFSGIFAWLKSKKRLFAAFRK